jgi:hypothetical protein
MFNTHFSRLYFKKSCPINRGSVFTGGIEKIPNKSTRLSAEHYFAKAQFIAVKGHKAKPAYPSWGLITGGVYTIRSRRTGTVRLT